MSNKKIMYICIGAVSILFGILCIFNSELAVMLSGIGLVLYGIGNFFQWRERKKAGAAGSWALTGMLAAVGFGIFILIGSRLGEFAIRLLLISLCIWLLAEGVLEILGAVMYRKAMTTADLGVQAPGSVSSMVLGAVMILVGVFGLIFPVFAGFTVWIWIVAALIMSGFRMFWMARSAGALEEETE